MSTKKYTPRIPDINPAPRLPFPPFRCISVNTGVPGPTFLSRVVDLIPSLTDWAIRHPHDWDEEKAFLRLSYRGADPISDTAEDLVIDVRGKRDVFGPEKLDSAKLLPKANRWQGDSLTYPRYVAAASLFKSVLRAYNSRYRTKKRLSIPSPDDLEPKLPAWACIYFQWFCDAARPKPANPLAWHRFYTLIFRLKSGRISLGLHDLSRLLELNGVVEDGAEEYIDFYQHAVEMLDRRSHRRIPGATFPENWEHRWDRFERVKKEPIRYNLALNAKDVFG